MDEDEYCDGCKHLKYDALENFGYCDLNKTPKLHPDEPENLYCESRGEDWDGKENDTK